MFIVFAVVMALVVMTLWNAIIPGLFGLKTIGFWTALGLLVLCRVLFGGMGMGPMMFRMARDHRQLHERWMNMSEEERQAFFQKRQRWGGVMAGAVALTRQQRTNHQSRRIMREHNG
jgi:hypothetical protein